MGSTEGRTPSIGFLNLPAELRNRIYELSGCVFVVQCENCKKHATMDVATSGLGRSCSGNPRIQWPIRYPRHFECRYNMDEHWWANTPNCTKWRRVDVIHSIDLSRYRRDWVVTHEFIDPKTQVLAMQQPHECRSPEQPALTKVCRLVRSETLPMFYGRNKFVFTPKVAIVDGVGRMTAHDTEWMQAIGIQNAALIRAIELRWSGWCRTSLLSSFLNSLHDLGMDADWKRIEISCWNGERWSSGFPSSSTIFLP